MLHSPSRIAGRLGRAVPLAAAVSLAVAAMVFAADGNNGTVKIHEGATDDAPEVQNEPQVCTFHLHFFFADAGQAGDWRIDALEPTGDGTVLDGSYLTDSNGEAQTVEYGLPVGHYALSWDGRVDDNQKHKTFWVTCDNPPGPIGGGIGGEEPPGETG